MTTEQLKILGFRKRKIGYYYWYEKTIKGLILMTQDREINKKEPNWYIFIFGSSEITRRKKDVIIRDFPKALQFITSLM